VQISKIEFSESILKFGDGGQVDIHVPVLFLGFYGAQTHYLKSTGNIDQNIRFTCSVTGANENVKVESTPTTSVDGQFSCLIRVRSSPNQALPTFTLQVAADQITHQAALSVGPVFTIPPKYKTVRFTYDKPTTQTIPVEWGLSNQKAPGLVIRSTEQQLEITPDSTTSTTSFTISLGKPASKDEYQPFTNSKVVLFYPETGQTVHLLVSYEPYASTEGPKSSGGVSIYILAFLIIFGALVLLRYMAPPSQQPNLVSPGPARVHNFQSPGSFHQPSGVSSPFHINVDSPTNNFGSPQRFDSSAFPTSPSNFQTPNHFQAPQSPINLNPFTPNNQRLYRPTPARFTLGDN